MAASETRSDEGYIVGEPYLRRDCRNRCVQILFQFDWASCYSLTQLLYGLLQSLDIFQEYLQPESKV